MSDDILIGRSELRETWREFRGLVWVAGFFSVFVNILMLTSPLFMLQTYDRVLGARSESTLVALFIMVAFLFIIMGVLDWARTRLTARMGARFQARLDRRVFNAMLKKAVTDHRVDETTGSGQQLKDLEAVNRFYASPVFLALFDAPFAPFFLVGLGLFHPWLGILALSGGGLLLLIALLNQHTTKLPNVKSSVASFVSDRYSQQLQNEAETIRSLGMQSHAFDRWLRSRQRALQQNLRGTDLGGSFSTLSRTFRQFLQSCMLALGAYLVLNGEITPGVMVASSILLGRALSPVETIVNQWGTVQRSRRAWDNIARLFSEVPEERPMLDLPRPAAKLTVQQITIIPPGSTAATLKQISFAIMPGEAVGVIGASGAGKSTLARALTGMWPATSGKIKLDGAPLDQYAPEKLAEYIGYLPQRVTLFDGTVAENIARLAQEFDSARVVEAARRAAAHEMILRLPLGYNTPVQTIGTQLSGGQIQRIGLARALYGDPVILVLDEPNSSLDNEGSIALNQAVIAMKAEGKAVLIMAHRPAAIKECDQLLVLEDGTRKAWGPREQIMSSMMSNVEHIRRSSAGGGGLS
jgi:ATP-binding cassette subfamily C protein